MCGQDSAVRRGASLRHRIEHDRARSISKQDAGAAIAPVQQARKRFCPDDKGPLEGSGLKKSVGGRECENEAGTYRLEVERRPVGDAKAGLDRDRGSRESVVGGRSGEHDEVDRLWIDITGRKRRARGGERKVRCELAWRRNPTLANSGALGDPLVGSVNLARQLVVGQNAAGQVTPAAKDDRPDNCHEETLSAACWPSISEIRPRISYRTM